MQFLIVGLGSMGKRRARLLQSLGHKVCGVDSSPTRRGEAAQLQITPFESMAQALAAEHFDGGFVCTSPLGHAGVIGSLLDGGLPVFTELNLVADGYPEVVEKAQNLGLPLFVSSTMLYRAEPSYIIAQRAAFDKPVGYVYHIGQYLPDWHPWENYKDFFVGDARTGGVREVFGIELPWLCSAFGMANPLSVSTRSLSALELPYPDSCIAVLEHADGTRGVLTVDVVSPKPVRNFELYGEGLHLFWEGSPATLFRYDAAAKEKVKVDTYTSFEHDTRYSDNIVENAYMDEILDFVSVLRGASQTKWNPQRDLASIALMDNIEALGGGV